MWRCCLGVLAMVVLVGCDGYPEDWSRVSRPWFSSCPNLQGTYLIGSNSEEGVGFSHGMHDSEIFRSELPSRKVQRWHWETMSIEGDSNVALQITLMRSEQTLDNYREQLFAKGDKGYYQKQYENMHSAETRWNGGFARMTDDEYAHNLTALFLSSVKKFTLKNGKDYTCEGGWLTGGRFEHDPGPDRNAPRADVPDGVVRFGKSQDGALVSVAIYEVEYSFSIWCGDGCKGVSLGSGNKYDWKRWQPAKPAWQGEIKRPWAESFQRASLLYPAYLGATYDSYSVGRASEASDLAKPLLPANVSLGDVQTVGHSAVLVVSSMETDGFAHFVEALEKSYRFTSVEVLSLERANAQFWRMKIRVGLKPRASTTSTISIMDRVRSLLPAHTLVQGIQPQDGGFMLTVRGLSSEEADATAKALNRSGAFRQATVNMHFVGADYTETRIRFFEI